MALYLQIICHMSTHVLWPLCSETTNRKVTLTGKSDWFHLQNLNFSVRCRFWMWHCVIGCTLTFRGILNAKSLYFGNYSPNSIVWHSRIRQFSRVICVISVIQFSLQGQLKQSFPVRCHGDWKGGWNFGLSFFLFYRRHDRIVEMSAPRPFSTLPPCESVIRICYRLSWP